MGLRFFKRNPKGVNVTLSSRGLRVSKTVKAGHGTVNIGTTLGGTDSGKTTMRGRLSGNGFIYEKTKTLTPRDTIPSLTNHLNSAATGHTYDDDDDPSFIVAFLIGGSGLFIWLLVVLLVWGFGWVVDYYGVRAIMVEMGAFKFLVGAYSIAWLAVFVAGYRLLAEVGMFTYGSVALFYAVIVPILLS